MWSNIIKFYKYLLNKQSELKDLSPKDLTLSKTVMFANSFKSKISNKKIKLYDVEQSHN